MKEIRVHCPPLSDLENNWEEYCLHTQLLHNTEFLYKDENNYEIYQYKGIKFKIKFENNNASEDSNVINILPFTYHGIFNLEKLYNSKNWTPMLIAAEKLFPVDLLNILDTKKLPQYSYHKVEKEIINFKDTTFYTDQVNLESYDYKNEFILTNTIYFWNRKHNMTLCSEYYNLLKNINFEYKFGFTVNRVSLQRYDIAKKLCKKEYCYVSQLKDSEDLDGFNHIDSDVNISYLGSDIPFFDLYKTKYFFHLDMFGQDLDMFFKIYFKFEVHIIDETWAEYDVNFKSINLSEKTLVPILFGSPFISTHIYPLQILDKIFSVGKHPFFYEIEKISAKPDKIVEFVEMFNLDYNNNVKKCRDYTNKIRDELLERIKTENSLLDKILT